MKNKSKEEPIADNEKVDNKVNLVLVRCGKCAGRGKSSFGGSTEGGYPCPSCSGRGEKYVTKCCGEKPEYCKCNLKV
jgi:hypothetical protein